jgi:hypothetical protein
VKVAIPSFGERMLSAIFSRFHPIASQVFLVQLVKIHGKTPCFCCFEHITYSGWASEILHQFLIVVYTINERLSTCFTIQGAGRRNHPQVQFTNRYMGLSENADTPINIY